MQQIIKDISEKALEIAKQHELTIIAPCAHEEFDSEKHEEPLEEAVDRISDALAMKIAKHSYTNDDLVSVEVEYFYANNDSDIACHAFKITVDNYPIAIFVSENDVFPVYVDFVKASIEIIQKFYDPRAR